MLFPNETFVNDTIDIVEQYAYHYNVTGDVIILQSYCSKALGLWSLLLNALFLAAMSLLDDRTSVANRLMWHLSISDLLACSLFLIYTQWPTGVFGYIDVSSRPLTLLDGLPYVFRGAPWVFFTGYLLTLVLLNVNHYVAVCKPWWYSQLFTRRLTSMCLLAVWLTAAIHVLLPIAVLTILVISFSDGLGAMRILKGLADIEMQAWMGIFIVCTSATIILHGCVYVKISSLRVRRRYLGSSNATSLNIVAKQDAFVTVSLLLLFNVFFRLPFPIFGLASLSMPFEDAADYTTFTRVNAVVVLLLYATFFADPIVYLLRVKELRKSYAKMMATFRCGCLWSLVRRYSSDHNSSCLLAGQNSSSRRQESIQLTSVDCSTRIHSSRPTMSPSRVDKYSVDLGLLPSNEVVREC